MAHCVEIERMEHDVSSGDVLLILETETGSSLRLTMSRNIVGAILGYLNALGLRYPAPIAKTMNARPLTPSGVAPFVDLEGQPGLAFRIAGGLELPMLFPVVLQKI